MSHLTTVIAWVQVTGVAQRKRLRRERDILKKAVEIFSKNPRL